MFPNRKKKEDKERIETYEFTEDDLSNLDILSEAITRVVKSDEFNRLAIENKWNTSFGHCAVASCAMQILAWTLFSLYVDTYCSRPWADNTDSHWYLKLPNENVIIDPTVFQFDLYEGGDEDLTSFYACGTRKGHPGRRQDAPYYTNSPPVKYIIDQVANEFGIVLV